MKKCIICSNKNFKKILKKDGWDMWHCNKCNLNFIWPQPTKNQLKKIYSLAGEYSLSNKGINRDNILNNKLDNRIKFFLENNCMKVLDIGCANGSFVYAAKIKGMHPIGIDLDPDSIKLGKRYGLDLRHMALEDAKFKENMFNAINLGDIIEHVKNPDSFLMECYRILKKGGVITVSTPNTNSIFSKATLLLYEMFGLVWSHPSPPYHLFDFSDYNLTAFLKKHGFEVEKVNYSKIPLTYSLYHTGYFNALRKKMSGVSKKEIFRAICSSFDIKMFKQSIIVIFYSIIYFFDKIFSRKGNQMVIYARKNNNTLTKK